MRDNNERELSSLEGTRGQFNGRTSAIKLGIDVHQEFYLRPTRPPLQQREIAADTAASTASAVDFAQELSPDSGMELPPLIAALNHAQNEQNAEAFAACFTEDAVVHDEPEEVVLKGRAAIKEWAAGIAQTKLAFDPIELRFVGDETVLTCRVSGDFPGSPISFDNHFYFAGSLIQRLVIRLAAPNVVPFP